MTAPAAAAHGAPGTLWDPSAPVGRLFAAIDDTADAWCGRVRGRRWADAAAALASNLSDYGMLWVLVALAKSRRAAGRRRAVVALGAAGVASYGVNKAAKRIVRRARPEAPADREVLPVRRPTSSSFPSGHTLASFCTAVVLPEGRGQRVGALTFAIVVAASRVHLRAHHASDVLGGALVGAALGAVVRPVVESLAPP